jgi:signal transduction histidine kinase
MIYNLCDNAIKYNKENGNVTVTVGPCDKGTSLSVSDTGIGIPYAHQNRVFERFYRVGKSHSKEIGGTGLRAFNSQARCGISTMQQLKWKVKSAREQRLELFFK